MWTSALSNVYPFWSEQGEVRMIGEARKFHHRAIEQAFADAARTLGSERDGHIVRATRSLSNCRGSAVQCSVQQWCNFASACAIVNRIGAVVA